MSACTYGNATWGIQTLPVPFCEQMSQFPCCLLFHGFTLFPVPLLFNSSLTGIISKINLEAGRKTGEAEEENKEWIFARSGTEYVFCLYKSVGQSPYILLLNFKHTGRR